MTKIRFNFILVGAATLCALTIYGIKFGKQAETPGFDAETASATLSTVNIPQNTGLSVTGTNAEMLEKLDRRSQIEAKAADVFNDTFFEQSQSYDINAPEPTLENMHVKPTGQYADQIDQEAILKKAEADGLIPAKPRPAEHQPSHKNETAPAKEEFSEQIDQQRILEQARLDGHLAAPTNDDQTQATKENISTMPDGDYAQEINPPM